VLSGGSAQILTRSSDCDARAVHQGVFRRRHAFDERHREFRKRARRGIETVLSAMDILLERRTDDPLIPNTRLA
jgi:hypothetical protein